MAFLRIQVSTAFVQPPPPPGAAAAAAEAWGRMYGQLFEEVGTDGVQTPRLGLLSLRSLSPGPTSVDGVAAGVWVVPGSHLVRTPPPPAAAQRAAVKVEVPAGQTLLLDSRLVHARTASGHLAVAAGGAAAAPLLAVGYQYRWLRPPDPLYVEPLMATVTCPVARQLLGYCTAKCAGCPT